jgi:hypothetical protein
MPEKMTLFVSHIHEEKELADDLKKFLESSFLGMVEVFLASDSESISLGSRWLDNISDALNKCRLLLVLCSKSALSRPWINFEAGAGWIRRIKVIPLCHTDLEPQLLPIPLRLLQGATLSDKEGVANLLRTIAEELSCNTPAPELDEFLGLVNQHECGYRKQISLTTGVNKGSLFSEQALMDASYFWWDDTPFRFRDGHCEERTEDGVPLCFADIDREFIKFADFDRDGQEEALVLIYWNGGGSGTFRFLHIVKQIDGNIRNIARVGIGDRTQINRIDVRGSIIMLDLVTHGRKDPLCCPTVRTLVEYYLQKGEFKEGNRWEIEAKKIETD